MQLRALNCLFALKEVRVADAFPESADRFAADLSAEIGVKVRPYADLQTAVMGADIIVTATSADEALVLKPWVSEGAFIASVGSYPELDPELVLCADKLVVDSWAQNCTRGELYRLIDGGRLTQADIHGELGAVVSGALPGRESDREIIMAALIGLGTHDLACAAYVVEKARRRGHGAAFDFKQTGA
jgi:ornithine cyclodeaminase